MRVWTVGHGTRSGEELVELLGVAGVRTVVDVRRFPGSRRHPQFNARSLATTLAAAGIGYRHAPALGGRLSGEPGEERFLCIRVAGFRSYAARMTTDEWQRALADELAQPAPAFLCAETLWTKCHRRLIAEQLHAREQEVVHLLAPGRAEEHAPWSVAENRDGVLHLCGEPVG